MKSFKEQLLDCSPGAAEEALKQIDVIKAKCASNLMDYRAIITAMIEEIDEMSAENYFQIAMWMNDSIIHLVNSVTPQAEREELN